MDKLKHKASEVKELGVALWNLEETRVYTKLKKNDDFIGQIKLWLRAEHYEIVKKQEEGKNAKEVFVKKKDEKKEKKEKKAGKKPKGEKYSHYLRYHAAMEGVHLNHKPEIELIFKEDESKGIWKIKFHHYARVRKLGIAAGVLTNGITVAVGAGTLAVHVASAKKFFHNFWENVDALAHENGTILKTNVEP